MSVIGLDVDVWRSEKRNENITKIVVCASEVREGSPESRDEGLAINVRLTEE